MLAGYNQSSNTGCAAAKTTNPDRLPAKAQSNETNAASHRFICREE